MREFGFEYLLGTSTAYWGQYQRFLGVDPDVRADWPHWGEVTAFPLSVRQVGGSLARNWLDQPIASLLISVSCVVL